MGFDALAEELGVEVGELRDALTDFKERQEGDRRDSFATALAEALGKPVDEVEAALERVGPGERGSRPCRGDASVRELAAALDVTRAELREALREARPGAGSGERFGLSEEEVEAALPEFSRPGSFGPGGPGEPGGPSFGPGGPGGPGHWD
jgi:hypothetical protein